MSISTIEEADATQLPRRFSVYVPMRDGVRVAVEVWLPESAAANGERVPTLCWFTRYWRALFPAGAPQREYGDLISDAGYAFVHVDARGSGASFGCRVVEYSDDEVADMGEVIDWIAGQVWSNGRVCTSGSSYVGNTAELAATLQRPALRAAVPRFTDFDFYDQILFPGGLLNKTFVQSWGAFVRALDRNDVEFLHRELEMPGYREVVGVPPVDGDDGTLLKAALKEHRDNDYYLEHASEWLFRDDVAGVDRDGRKIPRSPLYAYRDAFERARVPMQHWIGWLDSATAAGALARFSTFDAPNEILIGPWNHGAISVADPFAPEGVPVEPDAAQQRAQMLDFLDRFARDEMLPPQRSVRYYTMGAAKWTTTAVWPPANVRTAEYYLHENGDLTHQKPSASNTHRVYKVDFDAGSGRSNRWATSMGGVRVNYGDRAEIDRRLLCFTGAPLPNAITITGHPQIVLQVASTHTDGAFIVYLEAVAPDGRVVYLTEGVLRAIHRRVVHRPPPYEMFGPYRSFLRADAWPLTPGVRAELKFNLIPTSVRVPQAYRLRIAIAGHDKDTFVRVPESGQPVITVFTGADAPSILLLPLED